MTDLLLKSFRLAQYAFIPRPFISLSSFCNSLIFFKSQGLIYFFLISSETPQIFFSLFCFSKCNVLVTGRFQWLILTASKSYKSDDILPTKSVFIFLNFEFGGGYGSAAPSSGAPLHKGAFYYPSIAYSPLSPQ